MSTAYFPILGLPRGYGYFFWLTLLTCWFLCKATMHWWQVPKQFAAFFHLIFCWFFCHGETCDWYGVNQCKAKYVGKGIGWVYMNWMLLTRHDLIVNQVQYVTDYSLSLSLFFSLSRHQWPAFGGGWPGGSNRDGTDLYWTEECRPQTGSVCQRQHQVRHHLPTCVIFSSLAFLFCIFLLDQLNRSSVYSLWWVSHQRLLDHHMCSWYNRDQFGRVLSNTYTKEVTL